LLALERGNTQDAQDQLANLQASLRSRRDRALAAEAAARAAAGADARRRRPIGTLTGELDSRKREVSQRAL
jgi:chemotaxis protein MotB